MQLIDFYRQSSDCLLSSCGEEPYITEKHLFYKNVAHAGCTRPLLTAYNAHAVAIDY